MKSLHVIINGIKNKTPIINFFNEEGDRLIFDITLLHATEDVLSFKIEKPIDLEKFIKEGE